MYSFKKFLISVAFRKNQPSARYIKNVQKDIYAYNVFIKSRSFSFTLFFPVLSKVKTLSALRCLVFKVFDTSDKLEIKANQY